MDKKPQQNKTRGTGRLSSAEQQQLAMLQQLGIPLDPSLMGYGLPPGLDPQQLMNPMAAGGYPFLNPAALQAFAGLGLRGQNNAGAAEWWNLAQNQALASFGAGYFPGMLPGFPMVPPDVADDAKSSSAQAISKADEKMRHDKISPRPDSASPSVSRLQQDWKASYDSASSSAKDRPDSHHSASSPFRPGTSKQNDASASSSWLDGTSNQRHQKLDEQVLQAELLKRFEQQVLLQQFQMQQQQQDQINAALQSVMAGGNLPGSTSGLQKSGSSEKINDQLAAMMQQFMQPGSMQGMTPAMVASMFSTPGALETMMAMSQLGGLGNLHALGNNQTLPQDSGRKSSPSTSQRNSSLHSPRKTQKYSASTSLSGMSKNREQSSSPHKADLLKATPLFQVPGGAAGHGLSADQTLLAMLYSQQLQYDELLKQQMGTINKASHDSGAKSSHHDSKLQTNARDSLPHLSNQYHNSFHNDALSAHIRANLHSPANSTSSSRGNSHVSPVHDFSSKASSRKQKEPVRSEVHGSSKSSSSKSYGQESMSETLKLLSTLASNPNLNQQELAALLSFPSAMNPSSLLAGMGPSAAALLDPSLAASQMSSDDLDKLTKNLAIALAVEQQKLEEQIKVQGENSAKKGKDNDNHVSVIHQSNSKSDMDRPSSSHSFGEKVARGKRSSADVKTDGAKYGNGDTASSDGDLRSEASADRNSSTGKYKRRRVITDEEEVMEPLKHGWNREIRFKLVGNQLRGEVVYIAPGGKKLRTFPDVVKHIEDNNITNLSRNNFSFSSRLRIGTFFEQKDRDKGNRQWHEMTEEELDQRIRHLDRGRSASPYPVNSDQMSNYSSSSKGEAKSKKKEKERKLEHIRLLKEQEEMRRMEQQRIEMEIRERIALEELERQRVEEARQQMLLMRALEARKRAEERERRKEEQRIEKMIQRERKLEQRRIAMQIARELKMPVEDMATIGGPDLPDLTRLQGTYDNKCPHQLSGNACGDLLMVLEFVKTFKECIRLEDSDVPTFEQLQLGLLNDPKHTPCVAQLTMGLLHQCLCDPGVPAPGPWLHCLTGVKVTDIDVSANNYSEILRLFIWARSGFKTEIAVRLETLPFLSLTSDEKATSLAFLVNELVCSRPICMEIEKNLDTMATLRRDKWMVEGQIRQLRIRIACDKNPGSESPLIKMEEEENSSNSFSSSKATAEQQEESAEEPSESAFHKKMEELTQQHSSYNSQLVHCSKPLRGLHLGQDRFKRRYWVLPNLGGVYVEGLESGISYEDDDESPDEDEEEEEEEVKSNATQSKEVFLTGAKSDEVVESEKTVPIKDDDSSAMSSSAANSEPMEVLTLDQEKSAINDTDSLNKPKEGEPEVFSQDPISVDSIVQQDSTSSATVLRSVPLKPDSSGLAEEQQSSDPGKMFIAASVKGSGIKNSVPINNSIISEHENCASMSKHSDKVATLLDDRNRQGIIQSIDFPKLQTSAQDADCRLDLDSVIETGGKLSDLPKSEALPNANDLELSSKGKEVPPQKPELNIHLPKPAGEDHVMAAAKAIAAKAVAASSHLLFPGGSPVKSKLKKEVDALPDKLKDKKSHKFDGANCTLPIGEHTINTLVQMGVNPTSLTSQQLEVLSHLDIPIPASCKIDESPEKIACNPETDQSSSIAASDQKSLGDTQKDTAESTTVEKPAEEKTQGQDIPMDLSRPTTVTSAPGDHSTAITHSSSSGPVKSISVKVEQPQQRDSPFVPVHDSPDPKFIDSKFFVPISFNGDVKTEQQYNQVMSSCPSPNTLANYIVSSVNYGQFPSLDDIKFPIRAPDVKEEPDAIPREKKRGWWRVETEAELRNVGEKLNLRGIREKQLHRIIVKNFEMCTASMVESTLPEHQFAVLMDDVSTSKNGEEEQRPSCSSLSEEKELNDVSSRFVTSENAAYNAEMQILCQVEELAAKCTSMGVVSPQWKASNLEPSVKRKDLTHIPLGPLREENGVEIKFDIANPIHHDPKSALGAAVELIGFLERAVFRRYLKPPLVRKGGASEFSSLPSLSESGMMDVAAGLRTWRNAVASSASASQLALCVRMLELCIAWDRSVNTSPAKVADASPVVKTKKRKADKKSTTPKQLSTTPDSPTQRAKKRRNKKPNPVKSSRGNAEGKKVKRMPIDTADVISKLTPTATSGDEAPLTNGAVFDGAIENEMAENSFDDSLMSADSHAEHSQNNCSMELEDSMPSQLYVHNSDNILEEYRPVSEPKKKKKKKKKAKSGEKDESSKKSSKPRKRADRDTVICRSVLKELQSHEDATWFLFPVDCKLVPGYRKIIKKPIDFHTIESRLKRGRYKMKDEFVSDVRLVFDNCQRFNEDDSNIGRAGHQIREFFERRWTEVLRDKYGETAPVPAPEPKVYVFAPVGEERSNSPIPEFEPVSEHASYQDSDLATDDS